MQGQQRGTTPIYAPEPDGKNRQQISVLIVIIHTSHERSQIPTLIIARYGLDRLGRTDIVPSLVLVRQVFHFDFRLLVCFLLDGLQESQAQGMIFFEGLVIEQQVFPRVHTAVVTGIESTRRTAGTVRTQRSVELVAVPGTYVDTDIRTVFNILGPLSNPAGANMELMGVFDQSLVEPLAQVMANLGVTRGMVVYGQDRLDEISMSAPTSVCEIKDGTFTSYELAPEQFGYERCEKDALQGGTPEENAQITRAILTGAEQGAKRQAVCLNAGAALYIAGKAETIAKGVRRAEQLLDSGAALAKLEEFIRESNAEEQR